MRYIGVDTPETVAPGEPVGCFGPRERVQRHARERPQVRLVFDRSGVTSTGACSPTSIGSAELFVNAELVEQGYARTLEIEPNTSHAAQLERLEREAGSEGRGLWGACGG